MKPAPPIRITGSDFGLHPESLALNPRFRPDVPRIKLEVEIEWSVRNPQRSLAALEAALVEICPTLRQHECRGRPEYRILQRPRGRRSRTEPFETPLAAAHLLEHVMIEAIAFVTEETLISGATGARLDSPRRFDIFVECPDASVAPLAVRLAVAWMTTLMRGQSLDGSGRPTLEVVRELYTARRRALDMVDLARRLARPPRELSKALLWLEKSGFVRCEGTYVYRTAPEDAHTWIHPEDDA